MTLKAFLKTWEGTRAENRIWRIAGTLLAAAVLVLSIAVQNTERTVVLVPPDLNEQVEIARGKADANYKESWALYLAQLMGNVTPGNAELIKQAVEPLLAADIHRSVMAAIEEQITELTLDRITLSFEPREVVYEVETDKVFVSGIQTSAGPSGQPKKKRRTYEFIIDMRNYKPVITHVVAYSGVPKTRKVLAHVQEDES